MFTATRPQKYSPSDPALVQRYCEIFEITDWRQLPKDRRLDMVFAGMPLFWKQRSQWLNTEDSDELLKNTPLAGAHSLKGTPAYQKLHGGLDGT